MKEVGIRIVLKELLAIVIFVEFAKAFLGFSEVESIVISISFLSTRKVSSDGIIKELI